MACPKQCIGVSNRPNMFAPLAELDGKTYPNTDYDTSFPVIRKGKRQRVEKHNNFLLKFTNSDEHSRRYLVASCVNEDQRFRSISVFKVKKVIKSMCGSVERFQPLKDGNVLVITKNTAQAQTLLGLTKIGESQVKFDFHPTLNKSRGVIACFDFTHLTDEELKTELAVHNVCDVKRIQKKEEKNGRSILRDTGTFVLTFNSPVLPASLDAYYTILKVRLFVRNPVRCKGCQRWGHFEDQCKTKQKICENCGLQKHEGDCSRPVTCPNCYGAHPAWNRQCPAFKKEFAILEIKAKNNISYFEAKKRYNEMQKEEISFAKTLLTPANRAERRWGPAPVQTQDNQTVNPFANSKDNGVYFRFTGQIDRGPPPQPPDAEENKESGAEGTSQTQKEQLWDDAVEMEDKNHLGASSSEDSSGTGSNTLTDTGRLIKNAYDVIIESDN